jgi:predicted nuclease of restriction endonuclease-like (RecB) superfamily
MSDNIPAQALFTEISALVDRTRGSVASRIANAVTMLYWEIGRRINTEILREKRADYGKQIVSALATQLQEKFGRSFELRNLRRMMQFAEQFQNIEIVSSLATQLSWSHFIELLPLKTLDAKLFYARTAAGQQLSAKALRAHISRKAFERTAIADAQLAPDSPVPLNTFKDPYIFDFLGLQGGYLENDLEAAILRELESFILEFGRGFAFVERQKRMIIDGEDFYLDLLFYHRILKRLVAVELKLGKFHAADKGQMELYLKWLNRYERQEGENAPVGLILCAAGSREQVELLEMHKDGIVLAEYWTELPPKREFEQKIRALLEEARERMAQRQLPGHADRRRISRGQSQSALRHELTP